ncbi:hypothetical protein KSP40_PGU007318 [Platanthera guangdongensis]|uniref:Uncharacterized protein n=1 Tax=Platanthera guangdongensis TaxID=2320717 RepID=A0ABR2MJP9_9ASPA
MAAATAFRSVFRSSSVRNVSMRFPGKNCTSRSPLRPPKFSSASPRFLRCRVLQHKLKSCLSPSPQSHVPISCLDSFTVRRSRPSFLSSTSRTMSLWSPGVLIRVWKTPSSASASQGFTQGAHGNWARIVDASAVIGKTSELADAMIMGLYGAAAADQKAAL